MTDEQNRFEPEVAPIVPETSGIDSPLVTVAEAALLLRCKPCTVRAMVADGRLPYVNIGRLLFLRKVSIEGWIEQSERQNQPKSGPCAPLKISHRRATRHRKLLKNKAPNK